MSKSITAADLLKPGTAYLPLPVLSAGDNQPNLFDGGYKSSANVGDVQDCAISHKCSIIGVGGSENLQHEITAIDSTFTRIPVDGNITEMKSNEGIGFAHLSGFKPEKISDLQFHIAHQQELVPLLQELLNGYDGPVTGKLTGAFKVLLVRTPNHSCSPAPKIAEALKDQVRFYFMHQANIKHDLRVDYKTLDEDSTLAARLGFIRTNDEAPFIKTIRTTSSSAEASIQKLNTDFIELRKGKGDQFTIHKQPLKMDIALQYAPASHIYEMGVAAGLHLHAIGKVTLNDTEVQVGGHILGFSGLKLEETQLMRVRQTIVKEPSGILREAYSRNNIGQAIAMTALELSGKDQELKSPAAKQAWVNKLSRKVNAVNFQSDKNNAWGSCVCNPDTREVATKAYSGYLEREIKLGNINGNAR